MGPDQYRSETVAVSTTFNVSGACVSLGRGVRVLSLLLIGAFTLNLLTSSSVHAAEDDSDEDAAKTTHATGGEKSLRRQYNGGRDEEELTVQAALPQPVRSPDGVPGAADANAGAHD